MDCYSNILRIRFIINIFLSSRISLDYHLLRYNLPFIVLNQLQKQGNF